MARGDREWVVMATDFMSDEEFRRAITEDLAGLENIGHRIGGAFVVTPLRKPYAVERKVDGAPVTGLPEVEYVVLGWHFKQVFMPAAKPAEPESAAAPADEEPAAAPAAE